MMKEVESHYSILKEISGGQLCRPMGETAKHKPYEPFSSLFCFKGKVGEHTVFLLEGGPVGSNSPNIKLLSLLGKSMQVVLLLQMLTRWLGYC